MSTVHVMKGAQAGREHLCRRCVHGQYTLGYRDSDVLVICNNAVPSQVVPFVVAECTEFWDRHRPSWEDMKRFALHISKERRKPTPGFRTNGFAIVPVAAVPKDKSDGGGGEVA